MNLFFELIQVSSGVREKLSSVPSGDEWAALFAMACRQAVAGVLFTGVEKVGQEAAIPRNLLFQWLGLVNRLASLNGKLDQRVKELALLMDDGGRRYCILKGQGTARLYPQPERRQCGDIDIWIEGERDETVAFLRKHGEVRNISIKHCDWDVFGDVEVEAHFIPTWFYEPIVHRRLQQWMSREAETQFGRSAETDFCVPTIGFNLVYSLVHIYRHLFDEGIGLRQLMDYYYILLHSAEEERADALCVLTGFKMKRFAAAAMFVMQEVFGMDGKCFLCPPDEKEGRFLLSEIMLAGNFGQYDERIQRKEGVSVWRNGFSNLRRNLRFLRSYPGEVLWAPAWKVWHYVWRKRHSYL